MCFSRLGNHLVFSYIFPEILSVYGDHWVYECILQEFRKPSKPLIFWFYLLVFSGREITWFPALSHMLTTGCLSTSFFLFTQRGKPLGFRLYHRILTRKGNQRVFGLYLTFFT